MICFLKFVIILFYVEMVCNKEYLFFIKVVKFIDDKINYESNDVYGIINNLMDFYMYVKFKGV